MQWTLAKKSQDAPATPKVMTVTQLTAQVKDTLERGFPRVHVEGEISGCKYHSSGHIYFTLKDSGAQISCAMWRSYARRLTMRLKDGAQVLVKGPINLYPPRGSYQLIAESVEPRGAGDLAAAFEALKKRLFDEGLFDDVHKQPLPQIPRRVGIVTSATGAALRDVLEVMGRRFPLTEVLLVPARVQGQGAGESVAAGIRAINELKGERACDVILVTRGGGSLEDLWAFNEEVVARAIFASALPVMSAVGHEVDITISDYVADARAPTPSAAAELLVPDGYALRQGVAQAQERLTYALNQRIRRQRADLLNLSARLRDPRALLRERRLRVRDLDHRLNQALRMQLKERRSQVESLTKRVSLAHPQGRVSAGQERLVALEGRLKAAMAARLRDARGRLGAAAQVLDALSPLQILGRGYALVSHPKGQGLLRSVEGVSAGDDLDIRLAEGRLRAKVTEVTP